MTITLGARRGKRASAFVEGAPDATPTRRMRGRKAQLTLTLPPALIERIDAAVARHKRSRASMVEVALDEWLLREDGPPSRRRAA